MVQPVTAPVLAAIDVGTNAVRLELARALPDGVLEIIHQERDPVRPGEGVFRTGGLPKPTADRLLATLRRYSALCRRNDARVRAVATSAIRDARNRDEVVRRARTEAGLKLEVVSGTEEARLICLGVLQGQPPFARNLCVDIGGGSTEVASALGEQPQKLWSVALGAVRLTELFETSGQVSARKLALLRRYTEEVLSETLPEKIPYAPKQALGSSGTIAAVVAFASDGGAHASRGQIARAVVAIAKMGPQKRRKRFDAKRAEIIAAGAVVLEGLMRHLHLEGVTAVQRGLRDGVLVDLVRRAKPDPRDHSLQDAALALGRRFHFDEKHSRKIAGFALQLFDALAGPHALLASERPMLETAALLHDIGQAVNHARHHKHTYYLIANADLPGISDRERELIARVARYHRRTPPEASHAGMAGLSAEETRTVRRLATILRVADSFDRSHRQPVLGLQVKVGPGAVRVELVSRRAVDLEIWDAEHEAALFQKVFRRKLEVRATHPRA
jgi:exopolyphosphatase/guanosine-5'-triphosphate,3'-diphosphate pyrophosphatase